MIKTNIRILAKKAVTQLAKIFKRIIVTYKEFEIAKKYLGHKKNFLIFIRSNKRSANKKNSEIVEVKFCCKQRAII